MHVDGVIARLVGWIKARAGRWYIEAELSLVACCTFKSPAMLGPYPKYKHLPFPFKAIAEFEVLTSGSAQSTVIIGLKPVTQAKQ